LSKLLSSRPHPYFAFCEIFPSPKNPEAERKTIFFEFWNLIFVIYLFVPPWRIGIWCDLEFGAYLFFGIWCLVLICFLGFGAWCLFVFWCLGFVIWFL
jgi:hypothetical protein